MAMQNNTLSATNYDAFVALMKTPRSRSVRLDTEAALSLCRNGHVQTKAPLVWLGVFWVALLAVIPTLIFLHWQYAPVSLFLMWFGARRSKMAAVSAVWRELRGLGAMPLEQRAELYALLVQQGMLHLAPEDVA